MSKLAAAALRVCKALDPDETFNADRVFKLLYLVDWKSILTRMRILIALGAMRGCIPILAPGSIHRDQAVRLGFHIMLYQDPSRRNIL